LRHHISHCDRSDLPNNLRDGYSFRKPAGDHMVTGKAGPCRGGHGAKAGLCID